MKNLKRKSLLTVLAMGSGYVCYDYDLNRKRNQFVKPEIADAISNEPYTVQIFMKLPLNSLSRLFGKVCELERPTWLKNILLEKYIRKFGCDLNEAEQAKVDSYPNLGQFFRRSLKPEVRPINKNANIVSPADGRVLYISRIDDDNVKQVKDKTYHLSSFLGPDTWINDPDLNNYSDNQRSRIGKNDKIFKNVNKNNYKDDINKISSDLTFQQYVGNNLKRCRNKFLNMFDILKEEISRLVVVGGGKSLENSSLPEVNKNNKTDSNSLNCNDAIGLKVNYTSKNSNKKHLPGGNYNDNNGDVYNFIPDSSKEKYLLPPLSQEYVDRLKVNSEGTSLYQCIIYLAPGDYHRFHSPVNWICNLRRHFPGYLLSVSPRFASIVPELFNVNERVVYIGKWRHGFLAMAAVGATNVGSIKIYQDPELSTNLKKIYPSRFEEKRFSDEDDDRGGGKQLFWRKGQGVGEFNLGSTIVLIFEAPNDIQFLISSGQKVKYGQAIVA